jgi:hypothetical protein
MLTYLTHTHTHKHTYTLREYEYHDSLHTARGWWFKKEWPEKRPKTERGGENRIHAMRASSQRDLVHEKET